MSEDDPLMNRSSLFRVSDDVTENVLEVLSNLIAHEMLIPMGQGREVEVTVSPTGRSVQVHVDGERWVKGDEPERIIAADGLTYWAYGIHRAYGNGVTDDE